MVEEEEVEENDDPEEGGIDDENPLFTPRKGHLRQTKKRRSKHQSDRKIQRPEHKCYSESFETPREAWNCPQKRLDAFF